VSGNVHFFAAGTNTCQISDASLPISRKAQREQERENAKLRQQKQEADAKAAEKLNAGTKRKRSDVEAADPKLQEFLEVMQPASKSKIWDTGAMDSAIDEPPTKVQAIEAPAGESDDEYQSVSRKERKKSPAKAIESQQSLPSPVEPPQTAISANQQEVPAGAATTDNEAATDDDWLRSHTSRLLDVMDPEDVISKPQQQSQVANAEKVTEVEPEVNALADNMDIDDPEDGGVDLQEDNKAEDLDTTLEAIRSNGRLFVRNLPYSATEDDLRKHFEQYGSLEEVR
jgi:multiple RNA-binding domain-containing protein 1